MNKKTPKSSLNDISFLAKKMYALCQQFKEPPQIIINKILQQTNEMAIKSAQCVFGHALGDKTRITIV